MLEAIQCLIERHERIETPQFDVAYQVEDRSFHVAQDSDSPWGPAPAADLRCSRTGWSGRGIVLIAQSEPT